MADDDLRPGEDLAAWGVRTGRYRADRVGFWRAQLAAEKRVMASAKTTSPTAVEAAIRSLVPVFAQPEQQPSGVWATDPETGRTVLAGNYGTPAPASDTPLLTELETQLYGPDEAERQRRLDLQAEAELQEQLAAEQTNTNDLSPEEERAIFGTQDNPAG